jgi:hypothetical protein
MHRHKLKSIITGLVAAAVVAVWPAMALAKTDNGNSNADNKVTICHATGSQTNPYVQITPNANGVVNGHIGHQDVNDIIPPFSYNDHGAVKQFAGQNWDTNGQTIFNNGCVVAGGEGGGTKDCDNDFDNSPAEECAAPQKDCDNDFDNSSTDECQTPTGGMGGGPTGTTNTTLSQGQVLAISTTGGQGGAQVATVPEGSVNGGGGAGSKAVSQVSAYGLVGSLLSAGAGLSLLNRRQN